MSEHRAELAHDVPKVSGCGRVASPETVPVEHPDYSICDSQFMDDVEQLKALRSYVIRRVKIAEAGTIELGDLNLLHRDEKGRLPTYREWADLERRSIELYQHIPEQERRRFLYSQLPFFVIKTATYLGGVALFSLVTAVAATLFSGLIVFGSLQAGAQPTIQLPIISQAAYQAVNLITFIAFLVWVAALGGMGSIAFIGMNALAVQEDATFDITNKMLIGLRILLGALFAVVLTVPFGFTPFSRFILDLFKGEIPSDVGLASLLLLLPFVLGFSTTLVIMILNQFVEAVQSFFGKRSSLTAPLAPPAGPPPVAQSPTKGSPTQPQIIK